MLSEVSLDMKSNADSQLNSIDNPYPMSNTFAISLVNEFMVSHNLSTKFFNISIGF